MHRLGQVGEFSVAGDDLIAAGQPTLSKIELTAGEAVFGSALSMLNDGDVYGNESEAESGASFTPSDGAVVTAFLDTKLHPRGYDITSIVSLTGSGGMVAAQERSSQKYDVAYSTADEPNVFIPLRGNKNATVDANALGWCEMRVTLSGGTNVLIARGVAKLRFTFHNPGSANLESMYREIDVFGSPSTPAERR